MTIEVPAERILSASTVEDIGCDTINIDVVATKGNWCVWYDYVTREAELYRKQEAHQRFVSVPCTFSQADMKFFDLLASRYGSNYPRAAERTE